MKRLPDWRPRLNALIKEARTRPHVWGEWDCALWTAAAVQAETGEDFAAPYRGRYGTEEECLAVLREVGPGSLLALCKQTLGEPIPVAEAWTGDVLYRTDHSLGICYDKYGLYVGEWLGTGFQGLISESALTAKYAFRVPMGPPDG